MCKDYICYCPEHENPADHMIHFVFVHIRNANNFLCADLINKLVLVRLVKVQNYAECAEFMDYFILV
jgi:hypothetical protein